MSNRESEKALLVNRLNGSRFAVHGNRLREGVSVISVRYSRMNDRPQRWTTRNLGDWGGWTIVHIEISDDEDTYCLDIDTDEPEVGPSNQAKIRKADGSDRQKWLITEDRWSNLLNIVTTRTRQPA